MKIEVTDPYEAFEIWMNLHGFQDIVEASPEDVNLERLDEAVEQYGNS